VDPEEMEIYEVYEKQFRIIFMKKFRERQENMDRQINEIWKTIYGQNEKFHKEIETSKTKNK
jgi:hypothetical protein